MSDEAQISEREREILQLVATGATNQQIAQQLNISVNTVKVHLRNIFGKIGVVSRTEATLYAVRSGLVTVERTSGTTAVADEPEEPPVVEQPAGATAGPAVPEEPRSTIPLAEPAAALPAVTPAPRPEPLIIDTPTPQLVVPAGAAPPASGRLNPLMIGLAVVALLAVGGLLATLLLRPAAPPVAPTAVPGAIDLPPAGQRWRELAPLPEGRADFALAAASFDGASYLYAIGGEDPDGVSAAVLRYDIAADSWARYTAKPTAVADVQAAVVGGKIYVPGGRTADGTVTDRFEAYNPQSDTWAELAPLPAPRSRYALAAVEGKLYLFGGWDGSDYTGQVWQYTPDSDSWATLTAMAVPRADATAVAVNGQIFLIGGENADGRLARNERYSPTEEGQGNPWTVRAPLPEPHSRLAGAGVFDQAFVFGGPAGARSYDGSRDAWQPVALPVALELEGLRAHALDNNRVAIVGGRGPDGLASGVYAYQALFIVVLPSAAQP